MVPLVGLEAVLLLFSKLSKTHQANKRFQHWGRVNGCNNAHTTGGSIFLGYSQFKYKLIQQSAFETRFTLRQIPNPSEHQQFPNF